MKILILFVLLLSSTFVFSQNKFRGKNIYSLIGQDLRTLDCKIDFEDYTITNPGGGYMLQKDNKLSIGDYGISNCYSATSVFYLFVKFEGKDNENELILDILEIDRTHFAGNKMTEYCETNQKSGDNEIFALVKNNKNNSEFYTKVVKAWRANKKTEKFELVKKKKIKRCGNEDYGI